MAEDEQADAYLTEMQGRVAGRDPRRLVGLLVRALRTSWSVSRRETGALLIGSSIAALVSVAQILLANRLAGRLLRVGAGHGSALDLLPVLIVLALVTAAGSLATGLSSQRQQLLGDLIARRTWGRLLSVARRVTLATFDDPSFYDRMQQVQTFTLTQPLAVVQGLLGMVSGLVGVAGVLVALLVVQPLLVPLVLFSAVPLLVLQRRGGRLEYGFAIAQTPGVRKRYAIAELLTGRAAAKEIRAFGSGELLAGRFDALYADYLTALRRKVRRRSVLLVAGAGVLLLTSVGGTLAIVALVDAGRLSLAGAAGAATAAALLGGRVQVLATGVGGLYQAALFLYDLDDFTDGGTYAFEDLTDDGPINGGGFDILRCEKVSYSYPGAVTPALQDIDLELRRGEVVALVGANGSGKTTLSKVLAHLYDATGGRVTWDGTDIRDLPLATRRRDTTVLFQDFVHYEMAAYDNVALGDPTRLADEPGVMAAAERAGVSSTIHSLPQGWETLLSQRFPGGRDLSGGQWQRLALARALFRSAPFVLLDEPTAALDPQAEADFVDTLRATLFTETVLFVSHRFSSVRHADRIVVLDSGRVHEVGTHAELMRRGDLYARLYALQAEAYDVGSGSQRAADHSKGRAARRADGPASVLRRKPTA